MFGLIRDVPFLLTTEISVNMCSQTGPNVICSGNMTTIHQYIYHVAGGHLISEILVLLAPKLGLGEAPYDTMGKRKFHPESLVFLCSISQSSLNHTHR